MRITGKELFPEESQGQILFETAGSTRWTIAGNGSSTFSGTVSGLSASGPVFSGAVSVGGAADTVGFFGTTPVAVQATTATTGTFAAGAGTAALSGSSWVGNSGTKAYTTGDVVSALKAYGLLTP